MSALAIGSEQRSSSPPRYVIGECLRSRPTNLTGAKKYFEQCLAVGDYYAESERVVGQLDRQRRGVAGPSRCCCSTRLRSLAKTTIHGRARDSRSASGQRERWTMDRTMNIKLRTRVTYTISRSLRRNRSQSPHARAVFFLPNEYGLAFVVGLWSRSNGRALVRVPPFASAFFRTY